MARRDITKLTRTALGVLLPVCLVSAQIATFAHALTTHHAFCSEHGQVVHVPEPAFDSSESESTEDGANADERGHHHCLLGLYLNLTATASTTSVEAISVSHARALPEVGCVGCGQVPLLLLAPKCSPPAAA